MYSRFRVGITATGSLRQHLKVVQGRFRAAERHV